MSSNILDSREDEQVRSHYVALSVRQPWAYLIVMAQKTIELRDWSTPYRGLLLIHAAKKVDREALHYFDLQDSGLDTGCVIGAVELLDVVRMTPDVLRLKRWEHRSFRPHTKSMYGFVLSAIQAFAEPVPLRGSLGMFDIVDADSVSAIREQLGFTVDDK
jgi:hypothetical protein